MYPDLYLMRHGQTEWNLIGRLQGRLDSPLTDAGIRQAEHQRALIVGISADCVTSPQGRARHSARLAFAGRRFRLDPRLVEIDLGDFAGQPYEQIRTARPELFLNGPLDWYDHAPGGEGLANLALRARAFLGDLRRPTLVMTHGITLRMLQSLSMGVPVRDLHRLDVEQGAVHVIRNGRQEIWR